eukprot:765269-Hanusia_phi.AAC.1
MSGGMVHHSVRSPWLPMSCGRPEITSQEVAGAEAHLSLPAASFRHNLLLESVTSMSNCLASDDREGSVHEEISIRERRRRRIEKLAPHCLFFMFYVAALSFEMNTSRGASRNLFAHEQLSSANRTESQQRHQRVLRGEITVSQLHTGRLQSDVRVANSLVAHSQEPSFLEISDLTEYWDWTRKFVASMYKTSWANGMPMTASEQNTWFLRTKPIDGQADGSASETPGQDESGSCVRLLQTILAAPRVGPALACLPCHHHCEGLGGGRSVRKRRDGQCKQHNMEESSAVTGAETTTHRDVQDLERDLSADNDGSSFLSLIQVLINGLYGSKSKQFSDIQQVFVVSAEVAWIWYYPFWFCVFFLLGSMAVSVMGSVHRKLTDLQLVSGNRHSLCPSEILHKSKQLAASDSDDTVVNIVKEALVHHHREVDEAMLELETTFLDMVRTCGGLGCC